MVPGGLRNRKCRSACSLWPIPACVKVLFLTLALPGLHCDEPCVSKDSLWLHPLISSEFLEKLKPDCRFRTDFFNSLEAFFKNSSSIRFFLYNLPLTLSKLSSLLLKNMCISGRIEKNGRIILTQKSGWWLSVRKCGKGHWVDGASGTESLEGPRSALLLNLYGKDTVVYFIYYLNYLSYTRTFFYTVTDFTINSIFYGKWIMLWELRQKYSTFPQTPCW